jgi:hypothetical protein
MIAGYEGRIAEAGGPFKPFFGLSGAVLGVKGPTLVAKNATKMGHPRRSRPRRAADREANAERGSARVFLNPGTGLLA